MTDARLKGEWLTAAAHDALSDQAYRVLHNGLMHAAEQGTDGFISTRELRFLYPGVIEQAWLDELALAGFWERTGAGYQFIDWAGKLGQSTAAEVDKQREANRNRQRRHRAKLKGTDDDAAVSSDGENASPGVSTTPGEVNGRDGSPSRRDIQRDSRRDVTALVGQDRLGKAYPVLSDLSLVATQGGEPTETRARIGERTGEITDDAPALVAELLDPFDPAAEPSPFCRAHPHGTSAPCAACGDARRAHAHWARAHPPRQSSRTEQNLAVVERYREAEAGKPRRGRKPMKQLRTVDGREVCADGQHVALPDGSCKHCAIRPTDLAHLREGMTA